MSEPPIFKLENIEKEIQILHRESTIHEWKSPTGEIMEINVLPTVYPPREDTELMAKAIMGLGPGKNRKCLEIGCGSGVLSIFASRQGWNITACDINPFAVACTKGTAKENLADIEVFEGGPSPKSDGEISQWTGGKKFDLMFWNLPYLRFDENVPELLGPMEEAALLDTDKSGLLDRALDLINEGILNDSGIALFLISSSNTDLNSAFRCYSKGLATRTISSIKFDDEEELKVIAVWKPYFNSEKIFEDSIASTNTALLDSSYKVGASICSPNQTLGHGRRGRTWFDSKNSFAGSWKIFDSQSPLQPGILQIITGLCVKDAISCISAIGNGKDIIIKWPNDLLINFNDNWKKVCGILVESRTSRDNTAVIVGIGINIAGDVDQNYDFPIGFLEDYSKEFTFERLRIVLDAIISSYFEEKYMIANYQIDNVKSTIEHEIKKSFKSLGKSFYRNLEVRFSRICDNGEIEIIDLEKNSYIIDDGESITWEYFN